MEDKYAENQKYSLRYVPAPVSAPYYRQKPMRYKFRIHDRTKYKGKQEGDIMAYVEKERRQHQHNLNALISEIIRKLGRNALDYLKPQTHLLKGSANKKIPLLAKNILFMLKNTSTVIL